LHSLLRAFRLFAAFGSVLALLAVVGAQSASASETKTFIGVKICKLPFVTVAPPNPGGYCLITQSNLKVLLGAHDYYTNPTVTRTASGGLAIVSSPITIRAMDERHSTATGHCTYFYPPTYNPAHGMCEFWSGTGKLTGFHTRWVVGPPTAIGVTIIGPYWFDRDGDEHERDD
jgi:hypothetical protein